MGGTFFSGANSVDAGGRVREALLDLEPFLGVGPGTRAGWHPGAEGGWWVYVWANGLGPWDACASHSRCTGEEGDLWREWSH